MYIAMNHFRVDAEKTQAFEKAWKERRSFLAGVPGFIEFHLLKGESTEEGAVAYASHTVWSNQAAFRAWTESEMFREAHSQGGKTVPMLKGPPRFAGWTSVL